MFGVVSSWIFMEERRRLGEVFPEPVRNLWNKWELRVLVLVSLILQVSLIFFGRRRKYVTSNITRLFIWCAYLLADWVATFSLGILFNQQGNSHPGGDDFNAFWAPFLLLHLGGPDTITAYALADNDLWLRHLLGMVVQSTSAIYITIMAWRGNLLSILTIPVLVCGIIKYAERSWVLRIANHERFRESLLSSRDLVHNYMALRKEFRLKQNEGFQVTAEDLLQQHATQYDAEANLSVTDESGILPIAYQFFETLTFKRLFVDLILGLNQRNESQIFFNEKLVDSETAFKVIEAELSFGHDVFYTKAPLVYTHCGIFFRFITSSSMLFVLLIFLTRIGFKSHKHSLVDLVITHVLMVGAVLLELFGIVSLVSSDWTKLWSAKHPVISKVFEAISLIHFHLNERRWSNSISQYNLLSFCYNQQPVVFRGFLRVIPLHKEFQTLLEKLQEKLEQWHQLKARTPFLPPLKFLIYDQLRNVEDIRSFCIQRGGLSLNKHNCFSEFGWTTELDFDHSILVWHIATDLCYSKSKGAGNDHVLYSKKLADYMMYLLVACPFMLPIRSGLIRFQDTCTEAIEFFQDRIHLPEKKAYKMLKQVGTRALPIRKDGERSMSVISDARRLAASLERMERDQRWVVVLDVWVEMLGYAANQCRGYYHVQQLEKGGELLTHVWLLMAHLGISEQSANAHPTG